MALRVDGLWFLESRANRKKYQKGERSKVRRRLSLRAASCGIKYKGDTLVACWKTRCTGMLGKYNYLIVKADLRSSLKMG
jgi:hypothetical protein